MQHSTAQHGGPTCSAQVKFGPGGSSPQSLPDELLLESGLELVLDSGLDSGLEDVGLLEAGLDSGLLEAGLDPGLLEAGLDPGLLEAGLDSGLLEAGLDSELDEELDEELLLVLLVLLLLLLALEVVVLPELEEVVLVDEEPDVENCWLVWKVPVDALFTTFDNMTCMFP